VYDLINFNNTCDDGSNQQARRVKMPHSSALHSTRWRRSKIRWNGRRITTRDGGYGTEPVDQRSYPADEWYPGAASRYTSTNGVMYRNSAISMANITDGSSNTLLMGEMSWDGGYYGSWLLRIEQRRIVILPPRRTSRIRSTPSALT